MAPCLPSACHRASTPLTAFSQTPPAISKGSAAPARFSVRLRRGSHRAEPRQGPVSVQSFAFAKALGLSKPRWLALPDFGLEKRRAVLDRFFGPINRQASLGMALMRRSLDVLSQWSKHCLAP